MDSLSAKLVDDAENEYGAPVSALTLDDNAVAIAISPGLRAGDHASLALSPAIEFLTIDHRVVTGARGSAPTIRFRRVPGIAHRPPGDFRSHLFTGRADAEPSGDPLRGSGSQDPPGQRLDDRPMVLLYIPGHDRLVAHPPPCVSPGRHRAARRVPSNT